LESKDKTLSSTSRAQTTISREKKIAKAIQPLDAIAKDKKLKLTDAQRKELSRL